MERQLSSAHSGVSKKIQANTFSKVVLCLYFAISIFEPYLNGILGSITKYYIFFTMFVLIYQFQGKLYAKRLSVAIIIWLSLKLVSLLWSTDYATPKLHFISQLGMVMFLLVLVSYDYENETLEWIRTTYWVSSGIVGLLSMFFSRSYLGIVASRQVLTIAGVEVDPNNQAALLMVGICGSLINIFYEKKWRILSAIILLINIYGCFLTGSRAALVTIAVAVFFCILLPDDRKGLKKIAGRFFLFAVIIVATLFLAQKLSPVIYNRLFNFHDYAEGSGRANQWTNVWKAYIREPFSILFGLGWGTATTLTGEFAQNGTNLGVHNTFLTMLCDVGVIGTLIFVLPVFLMMIKLVKQRIHFPVMLVIVQFVPAFFIDAINKRFFWNAIFMLGMYYYHYNQRRRRCEY